MIVLTVWNNGDRQRFWIPEFEGDCEENSSGRHETLFDWTEDKIELPNRIRIDRLKSKDELHLPR